MWVELFPPNNFVKVLTPAACDWAYLEIQSLQVQSRCKLRQGDTEGGWAFELIWLVFL